MQNRIDRLESLVLSLMTNGAQSAGTTAANRALSHSASAGSVDYSQGFNGEDDEMVKDENEGGESETDQVVRSLGVLKVDNNKSMYFGEAHWATILNDIAEVRNYWTEHKKQHEEQWVKVEALKKRDGISQGPAFLFGGRHVPPYSELLAALPPRQVVDKLVSRYWNEYDPAIHILHPPAWRRLYEKHWQDPTKTDAVWLGQIYAIMCLAMHSYHRGADEPVEYRGRTLDLASDYRALTAQCLLAADFTKPVTHMTETLILHLHGEFSRSREAEVGVWVLVGMIVRLAMRMGFHRDPKNYPNLTPFQGEMRRRVWTFVRQSDLLFSFQLGLPSMIRLGDCDTELPRNVFDDEFDEDTKVLPLSRPNSVPTPVSYMIAKANMAFAFGKIVESIHAIVPCPYEKVMELDDDLRANRANLPPHLRLRPLEESVIDPVATLMQRYGLSILYNKGQCVLHRKYLANARENGRYAHSRRTCIDSSMELLRHQATLHFESRPGRRLYSMKWYINSLTTHDFLLAATLVCLDLWFTAEAEIAGRNSGDLYTWGLEKKSELMQALEISKGIWYELRDQSMEAYKAAGILTLMIENFERMQTQSNNRQAQNIFPFPQISKDVNGATTYTPLDDEKPEHSAAMTLGMLSSGGITPNPSGIFGGGFPSTPGGSASMETTQSSGVVPNYTMEQAPNGASSAPGPFNLLTNSAGSMDMPPTNLDWVCCHVFCFTSVHS